ncbi:hypothetical protein MMC24_007932 [Lignoscripta atroalba]|nr:hypothetical protein [Lignoscripta atroalba]
MSSSKTPQEVVELVTDEHKLKAVASKSHGDITLVPQPSDDPRDPLNWPTRKKNLIFFTVCLAAFSGVASVNVHQLAYVRQASYYHKSPAELSHSISAGIAGLVGGPLLFVPLASVIGRSSLVFWCQVVSLVSNIWGPLMTGPNDYIPFVMSRLMAGLFGIIPAILASGYIMDLYFLHQRGKAFTALEVCLLAGAVVAPVFGGFIANSKPWPYVYWWLVAVIGVSVILSFVFLRETSFERDGKTDFHFDAPKSFIANRIATFFPGTAVVPRTTVSHIIKRYVTPFRIGLSPVALIPGIFVILIYGFAIGLGIEASIFLQTPEARGGYGFTPLRNALFNFSYWSGLILCQICGALLNDRLPLWISRRNGGTWHPEYRLYNILLVIAASPIGLGIFGAGLE